MKFCIYIVLNKLSRKSFKTTIKKKLFSYTKFLILLSEFVLKIDFYCFNVDVILQKKKLNSILG